MSCGSIVLADGAGGNWSVSCDPIGIITTTKLTGNPVPGTLVLTSPSFYWNLSITTGLDGKGVLTGTQVAPTLAVAALAIGTSPAFTLTIDDNGIFKTASTGAVSTVTPPLPQNVAMSTWPNLGLLSSQTGTSPLVVSADGSIWSCLLNKFVNSDTTNIIVVLDE